MGAPSFDADDLPAVASGLTAYFTPRLGAFTFNPPPARVGNGLDTYIYAFGLTGAREPWDVPLILRVYPSTGQAAKARREAAVQTFVSDRGFSAPQPLALETDETPFGLPFMVMARVPGVPAMDRLKNPLVIPAMIRTLATVQARLHQLPTDGCPLPSEPPLVDRMIADLRSDASQHGVTDAGDMIQWSDENGARVRDETPSVCHNDFHPLNVMIDRESAYVLDWSDAALGDRHCDLARTLALLWLAPPLARSTVERTLLTLMRGYLVRSYRRAYERVLPVDDNRLMYWQALHAVRAFVLVRALRLSGDEGVGAREGANDSVPPGFEDSLRQYFDEKSRLSG